MVTKNRRMLVIITIGIVAIVIAYLAVQLYITSERLKADERTLQSLKVDKQVLSFTKLFIDKVLKSDTEVDFNTRLELENDVRAIKDDAILAQWNLFVNSHSEADAQSQVKNLLALLVAKISD